MITYQEADRQYQTEENSLEKRAVENPYLVKTSTNIQNITYYKQTDTVYVTFISK